MENKGRSPRYPSISLGDALERVKLVYKKEHQHKADKEVIAKDMGYAGLNGASLGVIASLKQYNLLETVGDGFKVSDDAVTLIELPLENRQREEALLRVAFAPKIFTELSDHFGDRLPSDENLRLFLLKKGFGSNAANLVIRTFRDTISLVKEQQESYYAPVELKPQNQAGSSTGKVGMDLHRMIAQHSARGAAFNLLSQDNVPAPAREGLNFQVTDDSINISFSGRVTQEIIRKLIKHLEINIDDYPTREQLERERLKALTTAPATDEPYIDDEQQKVIDEAINRAIEGI
jgi:hypothetical protein